MDKTASQKLIVKVAANLAGTMVNQPKGDLLDKVDSIYNKKSPLYKGMQRLGEKAYDAVAGKPDYSASPEAQQMWNAAYKRQTIPRTYDKAKATVKSVGNKVSDAVTGTIDNIKQYKWW